MLLLNLFKLALKVLGWRSFPANPNMVPSIMDGHYGLYPVSILAVLIFIPNCKCVYAANFARQVVVVVIVEPALFKASSTFHFTFYMCFTSILFWSRPASNHPIEC